MTSKRIIILSEIKSRIIDVCRRNNLLVSLIYPVCPGLSEGIVHGKVNLPLPYRQILT